MVKLPNSQTLLVPRVGAVIDRLPFNSEAYRRAKNILMNKSEKPRDVADAQIQCII